MIGIDFFFGLGGGGADIMIRIDFLGGVYDTRTILNSK